MAVCSTYIEENYSESHKNLNEKELHIPEYQVSIISLR